jgi:hypothetical protein
MESSYKSSKKKGRSYKNSGVFVFDTEEQAAQAIAARIGPAKGGGLYILAACQWGIRASAV